MARVVVVQLISSRFYGGPERQIVGLARALRPAYRSVVGTFPDGGRSRAFRDASAAADLETFALEPDAPRYAQTIRTLARVLRRCDASLVCTHHYKADLAGRAAAWLARIPCVSVSHGWTAETRKVRFNEALDRGVLRFMDAVVCVSDAQAAKVRRAGVAPGRVRTIRNAIDPQAYGTATPAARGRLTGLFPRPPQLVVGVLGRLSPEKGIDVLIDAMRLLARTHPEVGAVIFGDGPLRASLQDRIDALGLGERVVLAGFVDDPAALLPAFDVVVLPSHTEGLPVVVLEAMASRVPVVATAVGGTPEALGDDGACGLLIPPADPAALAAALGALAPDGARRRAIGEAGRRRVETRFTFAAQAQAYGELFTELVGSPLRRPFDKVRVTKR